MNSIENKAKHFSFFDHTVNYKLSVYNDQLTIICDHPYFVQRFGGDTAKLTLAEFLAVSNKGQADYPFFQKFHTALQQYFLDHGV